MSAAGWPDAFLRVLSPDEILRESYMFSVFRDGSLYCKLCGALIDENRQEHREFHSLELEIVLEERRVDAAQRRQEALRAARAARV